MMIDPLIRSTAIGFLILAFGTVGVAENRTWIDASGQHRVEAEFVKMANGQVTLLRADGREVKVPLARLSEKDQDYIARLRRTRRTGNVARPTDHGDDKGQDKGQDRNRAQDSEQDDKRVSVRGRAAAAVEANRGNQFKVPDGNARKLLDFMSQMQTMKPPTGGTPEANAAFHRDVQWAIVQAADKLLGRRARKPEVALAVGAKLNALTLLSRMSRDAQVEKMVKAFPNQLRELNQPILAKSAQTLALDNQLATAKTNPQVKATVQEVSQHLNHFGNLTSAEIALARAAGRASQRLGPEFAAETYQGLAETLIRTPTARKVAETMLGTARRYGLVGNEMHLVGFTTDNRPFDLKQLQGKVVLVDFWATWCKPCMDEMPNIRRNYEKYHDRGFEVVAVSVDNDFAALQKYIAGEAPPWTVLVDKHPQTKTSMSAYYAISGIPTTLLIGPDGKVLLFSCQGERLGKELERLLGGAES